MCVHHLENSRTFLFLTQRIPFQEMPQTRIFWARFKMADGEGVVMKPEELEQTPAVITATFNSFQQYLTSDQEMREVKSKTCKALLEF